MNEFSAVRDPDAGTMIGQYRVCELIGTGGMGTVYRAIAPDGTVVALKRVKPDYARDETFRRRFHREARIAQSVDHPNVVAVLEIGEHGGTLHMAQRFVDGCSLEQRLKAQGTIDVPSAMRLCHDVAGGLEALWAAGMVHRDVKPGNILIDRGGTAFITDFGLAKDMQGSMLTLPGQAIGSVDYMAPEQIRAEAVSAASDVYALGCVMYEALCGRTPFADAQGMRILWAHLQDVPPDPCSMRPELSPRLSQTILRALAKDAAQRPASATEYARALAAAAG